MTKRTYLEGREPVLRTNVSLSESDLEIARVLGKGNASEGLRTALRMTIKLNQIAFDELS
jgi:hypothetical protein